MRVVSVANFVMPSAVMVKFMPLMFVVHRGSPVVRNIRGMEIVAIINGMKAVRVRSCFNDMWEVAVSSIGVRQIMSKCGILVINSAEIIMAAMAASFAMGCIFCSRPFLSLRSSM